MRRARSVAAAAEAPTGRAAPEGAMSAQQSAFGAALVPRPDWGDLGASDHGMLVYDEEAHLLGPAGGQRGTRMRRQRLQRRRRRAAT